MGNCNEEKHCFKVLTKNGFNHEGTFPKHDLKWGKFEDVEYYGLLNDDFI